MERREKVKTDVFNWRHVGGGKDVNQTVNKEEIDRRTFGIEERKIPKRKNW